MNSVRIEVPGDPVGKARPRFTRTGRCYNTRKTKEFETRVANAFLNSGAKQFGESEPLRIDIVAEMPIPKSTTKKVLRAIEEGSVSFLKKPDIDNIVKAVLDGLNGIAFPDDKQIVMLSAFKKYSKEPKTIICISEAIMKRNDSQKIKILKWMQTKGSITQQDALTFGCMRLAARIKNLRSDGYDIITDRLEYIDNDGRKVSYASYRLRTQECAQTTDT